MTEDQIVNVIEDTVVNGSKTSQGDRFVADYDPNAFGIDNVKAVVAVDDGSIITAYPTSGPSVCVYSDKQQRVIGGDCR
jgi:thiamine biosynthesis lipoprotein ApbE